MSTFSSVAQSCLTLCDLMDCSMPGLPVHHQLPELTQTRPHWVSDAIQPSHPLLSPSPPTFNLSQHHGLFQWVSSSHQVAKVLEFLSGASVRNPTRDKVLRKEAWQNARTCSASGIPPGNSWASTPKARICLLYYVMLSTYSSVINRALSPHHLFLEKVRAFR